GRGHQRPDGDQLQRSDRRLPVERIEILSASRTSGGRMQKTPRIFAGFVPFIVMGFGLGCATPPPVAAPGLGLRKVVIYRNGIGYFERGGRVQSDSVQFKVRKDEVGDFLATLAVLERGGSSVRSASFPMDVASEDAPPREPPRPGAPAGEDSHKLSRVTMALDGKE